MKRKFIYILSAVLAALLILTGCQQETGVLARVNGEEMGRESLTTAWPWKPFSAPSWRAGSRNRRPYWTF